MLKLNSLLNQNYLNASFRAEINQISKIYNNSNFESIYSKLFHFSLYLLIIPLFLALPIFAVVLILFIVKKSLFENIFFYSMLLVTIFMAQALFFIILMHSGLLSDPTFVQQYRYIFDKTLTFSLILSGSLFILKSIVTGKENNLIKEISSSRNNEFSFFFKNHKNPYSLIDKEQLFFKKNFYSFYSTLYPKREHLFIELNKDFKPWQLTNHDNYCLCKINSKTHLFINFNLSTLNEKDIINFKKDIESILENPSLKFDNFSALFSEYRKKMIQNMDFKSFINLME